MRRYIIFTMASLGMLMAAIDLTAVAVALPAFTSELHADILWSGWTMSIYYIGLMLATPLIGKFSDTFGRKKAFLVTIALFTGASLACGMAPGIAFLIICRFIQGIGGAGFMPTASAIVSDYFPKSRSTAIGLFSSINNVGAIIGPNLGGWIVSRFSWHYIFYINLPIGVVLIGLTLLLLKGPEVLTKSAVDLGGAFLLAGSILFGMFGLNLIGDNYSSLTVFLGAVAATSGLASAFFFMYRERRVEQPIIDLVLIRSRPFLAANILNVILGACFFGLFAFIPLYAVSVHHFSTLASGMILTPRSIGVIFTSVITSFLLKRLGYRRPITLGFGITGIMIILLIPSWPFWHVIASRDWTAGMLFLVILGCGIGAGVSNPAASNACIELMPERVATIRGLRNFFRTMGGSLGVFVITFILHFSGTSMTGFAIVFACFGAAMLCAIPLVLVIPDGRLSRAPARG